jgi:hypothetical protein
MLRSGLSAALAPYWRPLDQLLLPGRKVDVSQGAPELLVSSGA